MLYHGLLHMDSPVLVDQQELIHQLCADNGYHLEDLSKVIADSDKWWESKDSTLSAKKKYSKSLFNYILVKMQNDDQPKHFHLFLFFLSVVFCLSPSVALVSLSLIFPSITLLVLSIPFTALLSLILPALLARAVEYTNCISAEV